MKYADGDVYDGQFKLGLPDGIGTFFYKNGTRITGEFKEGKLINNNQSG